MYVQRNPPLAAQNGRGGGGGRGERLNSLTALCTRVQIIIVAVWPRTKSNVSLNMRIAPLRPSTHPSRPRGPL
jgi:hypothetical protein